MAIITKITTQKKSQDRFNVFMDYGKGEEFAFSIDSEVLIKFQLKKGMELDDLSFLEVQFQDDIRKAYNTAINYLARRMRSTKEVRDYLIKKDIDVAVIGEVLHKLSGQNYLNDLDFAIAFVRTQANTTDKGATVVKMELKEKGIDENILAQALEEFPLEQQIDKAVKISEKFFQKNSKESPKIQKQKLEALLHRKGYSFDVISIAVNETESPIEADDELEAIRFQGEKAHRKLAKYTGYEYTKKMKQVLYRKGFSMDLIERYLEEKENS